MADPVTIAVVGATAGAAMNRKDPLKGALIGATLGYGGGAALGATGLGAAGTAAGTGAAAGTAGAATTAGTSALTAGGTALGGGAATSGLVAPAMTGFGLTPAAAGMTAGSASLSAPAFAGVGLNPAATVAGQGLLSGTMAGLGADMTAAEKWMGNNPTLTKIAMGTGMQALEPNAPPSGGLIQARQNQMQFAGMPQQPFMNTRKISLI